MANSEVRLQKFMADNGIASRRKSEELIAAGKVKVNGHRATIGQKIHPKKDVVSVQGKRIVKNDVSVREVERMAKRAAKDDAAPLQTAKKKKRDAFFDEVELSLSEALGRKVKVYNNREKGTLEIEFYNKEDLKNIANVISREE